MLQICKNRHVLQRISAQSGLKGSCCFLESCDLIHSNVHISTSASAHTSRLRSTPRQAWSELGCKSSIPEHTCQISFQIPEFIYTSSKQPGVFLVGTYYRFPQKYGEGEFWGGPAGTAQRVSILRFVSSLRDEQVEEQNFVTRRWGFATVWKGETAGNLLI